MSSAVVPILPASLGFTTRQEAFEKLKNPDFLKSRGYSYIGFHQREGLQQIANKLDAPKDGIQAVVLSTLPNGDKIDLRKWTSGMQFSPTIETPDDLDPRCPVYLYKLP